MIETDRLVAADPSDGREEAVDRAIRPRRLDDYIGQTAVREQMEIFLSAARGRGEPLDHTLIFGPPGLGKTTLASIIAEEMGVQLKTTSGPILEKAGDIAALMTNLEPGDVLFIDEIHTIVGAGGATGSLDTSNMFKPALARGELRAIGATTLDEYQKYFEKDKALERRFQKVLIDEPSNEDAISILRPAYLL